MDGNLRRCCVDRLTSLPDELLIGIMSLLPTRDVVATQAVSKKLRQDFTWITSVDFDDSPISHCIKCPHLVERLCHFESFIDNVLHKLTQSKNPLTQFRLTVGGDKNCRFQAINKRHDCDDRCFPFLDARRLYSWISYPSVHHGLKELDLYIHLNCPHKYRLPLTLLTCPSLESLKLDSNIEIHNRAEISLINLPNLKLLHLCYLASTANDFVFRLVSSCPALKDLSITYRSWNTLGRLSISSRSLQRLVLDIWKCDEKSNTNLVVINAPNLKYLQYDDYVASRYRVTHMNALFEAHIRIVGIMRYETGGSSFQSQLSLVRALSNVQHLSLLENSVESVYLSHESKNPLPVFCKLRTLELDSFFHTRWDIVLLLILNHSPFLETLVFPKCLMFGVDGVYISPGPRELEVTELEDEGWITAKPIPSCCRTHLKRIVLNDFIGFKREINMISFFLRKASVLKELVICLSKGCVTPIYNQLELQSILKCVPKDSNSCSITVQ